MVNGLKKKTAVEIHADCRRLPIALDVLAVDMPLVDSVVTVTEMAPVMVKVSAMLGIILFWAPRLAIRYHYVLNFYSMINPAAALKRLKCPKAIKQKMC